MFNKPGHRDDTIDHPALVPTAQQSSPDATTKLEAFTEN
jgi:hypothetical protein